MTLKVYKLSNKRASREQATCAIVKNEVKEHMEELVCLRDSLRQGLVCLELDMAYGYQLRLKAGDATSSTLTKSRSFDEPCSTTLNAVCSQLSWVRKHAVWVNTSILKNLHSILTSLDFQFKSIGQS